MNKEAKKNNGIKDSISKLFILRDSCTGTCITQKDNPNIIWFEGAAILLQQGVDKLKSAQQKIDSNSKDAGKDFNCNVKETVSKLIVLKRSWVVSSSEESAENVSWFEGAESIICEVVDQLQKALLKTETQAVISSAADSSESEKSTASEAAEESGDDAVEAEKQAAAG
jgi:hypothetical protein